MNKLRALLLKWYEDVNVWHGIAMRNPRCILWHLLKVRSFLSLWTLCSFLWFRRIIAERGDMRSGVRSFPYWAEYLDTSWGCFFFDALAAPVLEYLGKTEKMASFEAKIQQYGGGCCVRGRFDAVPI